MRIVSLVPSLSQTIAYRSNYKDCLVACTNFCVDPSDLYKKTVLIGGTRNPDIDLIKNLKPTHVLANYEENTKESVEQLEQFTKVCVTNPKSPKDVVTMLMQISDFFDLDLGLEKLALDIKNKLDENFKIQSKTYKSLYFIWNKPYMVCGQDTYISNLMEIFGFLNLSEKLRYPTLSLEQIRSLEPELILLSSEPFAFRKRHATELKAKLKELTSTRYFWVDGRMFSWHGLETLYALEMASELSQRPDNLSDKKWIKPLIPNHEY